ncbi:unnamed protein product [Camellia sinensis]
MASTVVNFSCNVGSFKGLDCAYYVYVGLKPSVNQNFVCVRPLNKACTRRMLVVRARETREGPMKKMGLSDEECEAAVVAGNVHEAPLVPPMPAAPVGTPVVSSLFFIVLNHVALWMPVPHVGWYQPLNRRPRRNRKSLALRAAFQETSLTPANFVYPLFIHEGEEDTPIGAMPGCYRLGWRHGLMEEASKARDVGVNSVVLFPKVPDALKSPTGDEAYNDKWISALSHKVTQRQVIYTDVALDPYSSDGHDGIVREDGAQAGADVVSPSDMMDGRVGAIRAALDAEGMQVRFMVHFMKH